MLLDVERLARERQHVAIVERETLTVRRRDIESCNALSRARLGVDHLDGLATEIAPQDRVPVRAQRRLVYVELVRIDRTLHDRLAQTVGAGDEDDVTKSRVRVQREHDAACAKITPDHVLHAD